jgi:hypothetical protein
MSEIDTLRKYLPEESIAYGCRLYLEAPDLNTFRRRTVFEIIRPALPHVMSMLHNDDADVCSQWLLMLLHCVANQKFCASKMN